MKNETAAVFDRGLLMGWGRGAGYLMNSGLTAATPPGSIPIIHATDSVPGAALGANPG